MVHWQFLNNSYDSDHILTTQKPFLHLPNIFYLTSQLRKLLIMELLFYENKKGPNCITDTNFEISSKAIYL